MAGKETKQKKIRWKGPIWNDEGATTVSNSFDFNHNCEI